MKCVISIYLGGVVLGLLVMLPSGFSMERLSTRPLELPTYTEALTQQVVEGVDPAVYGIHPIELRIAAAERVDQIRKNPAQYSLGLALDGVLKSIALNSYPGSAREDFHRLLESGDFLRSLVKHSPCVKLYRKSSLTIEEAKKVMRPFMRSALSETEFSMLESALCSRLATEEERIQFDLELEAEGPEGGVGAVRRWLMTLEQDSSAGGVRSFLRDGMHLLKDQPELLVDELELLLERMPTTVVEADSEKDLLPLRDHLRTFSKNDKWTAFDLLHMKASLNLAVVSIALAKTVRSGGHVHPLKRDVILARVTAALADSFRELRNISDNPDKPKLAAPPKRKIFVHVIEEFVQSQLNQVLFD